jgi:acetyl-CoA carboxylase alpha subunit
MTNKFINRSQRLAELKKSSDTKNKVDYEKKIDNLEKQIDVLKKKAEAAEKVPPPKSTVATSGTNEKKPDYVDASGKEWFLKAGETVAELKERSKGTP